MTDKSLPLEEPRPAARASVADRVGASENLAAASGNRLLVFLIEAQTEKDLRALLQDARS